MADGAASDPGRNGWDSMAGLEGLIVASDSIGHHLGLVVARQLQHFLSDLIISLCPGRCMETAEVAPSPLIGGDMGDGEDLKLPPLIVLPGPCC